MADPRRLREILGFGYGAPSPAMSALEPFHAGVDPAYMPQDVVTESPWEGPRGWVRSGLESLFGAIAPSDRAASNMAEKVTNLSDFVNVPQEAFDIGKGIGDAVQGGDKLSLAMSMIPGKAADEIVPAVKAAQKQIKVYHSSPHDFPEFKWDSSVKHTGEGNSTYGEGVYFAESPAVSGRGGSYDRQFTAKKMGKMDTTSFEDAILREMGDDPENISDAEILHRLQTKGFGWKGPDGHPAYEEMEEAIKKTRANASHIYEANLNAAPEDFLQWEQPLRDDPRLLQTFIDKYGGKEALLAKDKAYDDLAGRILENKSDDLMAQWDAMRNDPQVKLGGLLRQMDTPKNTWGYDPGSKVTGQSLYEAVGPEALKEVGVPGSRYRDAGSRTPAGEGSTHNYAVWAPEIIDIVKKYGIAGALGAGLITQQMADQLQAQQGGGQS